MAKSDSLRNLIQNRRPRPTSLSMVEMADFGGGIAIDSGDDLRADSTERDRTESGRANRRRSESDDGASLARDDAWFLIGLKEKKKRINGTFRRERERETGVGCALEREREERERERERERGGTRVGGPSYNGERSLCV